MTYGIEKEKNQPIRPANLEQLIHKETKLRRPIKFFKYQGQESNLHVLRTPDPKSGASTSFATLAFQLRTI